MEEAAASAEQATAIARMEFFYTYDDMVKVSGLPRKVGVRFILRMVFIVAFVTGMALVVSEADMRKAPALNERILGAAEWFVGIACVLILSLLAKQRALRKAIRKALKRRAEEIASTKFVITIYPWGLVRETARMRDGAPWRFFHEYIETADGYNLLYRGNKVLLIPKRAVSSDCQVVLGELFQQHMGKAIGFPVLFAASEIALDKW